jgi:transcriptional regulator with XRE-family HTH domain
MWKMKNYQFKNPSMARSKESLRKEGVRHYIKEWRKFRGLTQERLAERTPFTHGAISQVETGRTSYTQEMLEALAVALDCAPGDLLNVNPLKEGEVVDLMRLLNQTGNRDMAIRVLKSMTGTEG